MNNSFMDNLGILFHSPKDETGVFLQVFVVVFATMLANYIAKKFFDRMEKHLKLTDNLWDDAFLEAIRKPVRLGMWIIGLSVAVQILNSYAQASIFDYVDPVRKVGIIVAFAWFLNRFIVEVETNVIDPSRMDKPMDETTASAIAKLLKASVIITTVLVILQTLGYSISGVLAFGGIGGMAVGFAAKDMLSNFFGGLMIYLDRPFSVGDWVRSPDRQIEGTVEDIGWRVTTIRTFDKRPLYIPNATFTTISVENPSRMSHRRIFETIGIRYDDSHVLHKVVDDVKAMLQAHPDIATDQTLIVNFNAYGSSSLDFFIYTFTKTVNWIEYHDVKEDVLFRIMEIIEANGAEFAFPTSTVHLFNESVPESIEAKMENNA